MSKDARDMFARMLRKKYGLLIKILAVSFLCDPNEVDDLLQEVIIKCTSQYKKLQKFNEEKLLAYLYTAVKRQCMNAVRDKKRLQRTEVDWFYTKYLPEKMGHIESDINMNAYGFSNYTTELLDELNSLDRDILVLTYYHGYSAKEVGQILDISFETVKKRLQRARHKMLTYVKEGRGQDEES